MVTILVRLAMHDPAVTFTASDVEAAYLIDCVESPGAIEHLDIARHCLLAYLVTPDDFYLGFARMELLRVRWPQGLP